MGIKIRKFSFNEIALYPSAFYKEGNNIWYVLGGISLLMRYDVITHKSVIVSFIPRENVFRNWNYEGIFKYREKLFMIPANGNEIAVYNTIQKQIKKLSLNDTETGKYDNVSMFSEKIFISQNKLYCFPSGYKFIIAIDMETEVIEYIFNVHDALKNAGVAYTSPYVSWAEPYENGFYALCNNCSYIWKWSVVDNSLSYEPFWPEEINDETIAYISPYFILYSPKKNRLFRYDLRNPQWGFTQFTIEGLKISDKQWNLRTIGNSLAVLDAENDAEEIFFDAQGKLYRHERGNRPIHVFGSFGCRNYRGRVGQGDEGRNIFYDSSINGYLCIDGKNKNDDIFLPNEQNISPDEMRRFLYRHCDRGEINKRFCESMFPAFGLKWFIEDVVGGMVINKTSDVVMVGEKIYEYLKK